MILTDLRTAKERYLQKMKHIIVFLSPFLYSETIYLLSAKTFFLGFTLANVTYMVETCITPGLHTLKNFFPENIQKKVEKHEKLSLDAFTQKVWVQVPAQLLSNFVILSLHSKNNDTCLTKLFSGLNEMMDVKH